MGAPHSRPVLAGEPAPGRAREDGDPPLRRQVDEALAGNTRAMRDLLASVAPVVARAVRRVLGPSHADLDDAAQQALAGLVARLPGFRFESSLAHFAQRIAVYQALTLRRDAGVRLRLESEAAAAVPAPPAAAAGAGAAAARGERAGDPADPAPSPASAVEERSLRALLLRALDGLAPAQAEALALHFFFGHTAGEIARLTASSEETVRSRLRLGKKALREHITKSDALAPLREGWSEAWSDARS
jgi:RNA polymerase sigma-70 factor (ECF subfamily)